jgi:hypothetical protein
MQGGDAEWFKYIMSAVMALFSGALGWLWRTIETERRERQRQLDKVEEDAKAGKDRLWRAVDGNRRETAEMRQYLLERYPTKDDMKEMEARLIRAIGGKE